MEKPNLHIDPERDSDATHCLEASLLAKKAFDIVARESAESIIKRNELAEFTFAQLGLLRGVAVTNSRWDEMHRLDDEIERRTGIPIDYVDRIRWSAEKEVRS